MAAMQLPIKFRAFSVSQQKLVYGYYKYERAYDMHTINVNGSEHEVYGDTVDMFTGFHDSTTWKELTERQKLQFMQDYEYPTEALAKKHWKGIEIYTRDILHERYKDESEESGYGETFNRVVFQDGAFGVIGEVTGKLLSFYDYKPTLTKVIGNTINNPEMIQKYNIK